MRAFDKSLMFNEACYSCAYTHLQRVSDFTMADYWGLGLNASFNHSAIKGVHNLSQRSSRPQSRNTFISDMMTMNHSNLMNKYSIKASLCDYLRLLKQ